MLMTAKQFIVAGVAIAGAAAAQTVFVMLALG